VCDPTYTGQAPVIPLRAGESRVWAVHSGNSLEIKEITVEELAVAETPDATEIGEQAAEEAGDTDTDEAGAEPEVTE
jgi:hypothetical protein